MTRTRRLLRSLFILLLIPHITPVYADTPRWTLEKVVEVSRHGVRPPTPGDRHLIEAGAARPWPRWKTADGELTAHGAAAIAQKGHYTRQRFLATGLFHATCPPDNAVYVRASPLQRTRATARALVDAVFPGCAIPVHALEKTDPLFQYPPGKVSPAEKAQHRQQAMDALGGDLSQAQARLLPAVRALQKAVCPPGHACPAFDHPWRLHVWSNGTVAVSGLDTLAAMAESIRLAWSENEPIANVAFGHARTAQEVSGLLPLLTEKYDFTNDLPGPAQRGASLLLKQISLALQTGVNAPAHAPPDARWLLFVAHDINIAYLRTLLAFTWQQGDYPRGNVPPGGSLIFERWRDQQQHRYLRIYFEAQSPDQIRYLTPLSETAPPLRTELTFPGCQKTSAGTLCPYDISLQRIEKNIDPARITPVSYPQP